MNNEQNYYLGNPNVRGADVQHPWTKEELIEYEKVFKISCIILQKNIVKLFILIKD